MSESLNSELNARQVYNKLSRRKYIFPLCIGAFCLISLVFDVMTGPAMLSAKEVLTCLFNPQNSDPNSNMIVRNMRLPVALMALAIGSALGSSGAVMQTILHNPLASPYTLGVGAGAAFGASLSIVMGWGSVGTSASAFLFSMLICLAIYLMGRKRELSTNAMVLSGIALLFLFEALQALIQYGSSEAENQAIVFWSFGSLQKTTWPKLAITAGVSLVCLPILLKDSWKYTAMLMGDEKAESLGIHVNRVKLKAFFIISLLSAAAVCFTGTIGFIGLAGPHVARMLVGDDQRFYILTSALAGMALLSFASIMSKVIIPGLVYPIGIITSLIGVPFFFILVLRRKGGR